MEQRLHLKEHHGREDRTNDMVEVAVTLQINEQASDSLKTGFC